MATVSRVTIAWGDEGVRQTLALMARLVDEGVDNPAVIMTARQLAVMGGVRQQRAQALAIHSFLKRAWRFVADPADRDLLIAPETLLKAYYATGVLAGDCDEAAVLGAALGKAIGLTAQFVVLGFADPTGETPDRFAHVYAVLLTDAGESISLDVTRPSGPVPPPTRTLVVDVA